MPRKVYPTDMRAWKGYGLVLARPASNNDLYRLRQLGRHFGRTWIAPDGIGGRLIPVFPSRHIGYPTTDEAWKIVRQLWVIPAGGPIPDLELLRTDPSFGVFVLDRPSKER